MKRPLTFFIFLLGINLFSFAMPLTEKSGFMENIYDYIENLDVFEQGQEDARAYYIPEHHILLNGQWKFYYADTPQEIPAAFYEERFPDAKWSEIDVPSNWEMRGFGDAQFRNVSAPFKANPPYVPHEYNPTGAYRTYFTVPENWKGEEVFLRFEKVASASFLWVNGQEVGYNEGAQEPAEYDITPYLKKGRNTLAMMVVKFSDGYYLEGQDYWRLAGIFDDVYLYSAPKTRLFDWHVVTDLDEEYRDAELSIEATVKSYDEVPVRKALKVKAVLTDMEGNAVAEFESGQASFAAGGKELVLNLKQHISNPRKWSAETPDLYQLKMSLVDAVSGERISGSSKEDAVQDVGFKETEIIDNVFHLNGKPLKVNAECSHMQDPDNGHRVSDELIIKDMTILKRYGFNGVRTSHYPPVPRYLMYAARYGLYIIDETGDEAHATEYVSSDERFLPMYRERVRRMVLRDRNQPAVLFWSAGNESGEGPNIGEVVKEGRKYDDTRYWMYGGNAYSHPDEDIIGPRYPTPLSVDLKVGLKNDGDVRPSFMDEYISVAGNGGGMFDEMWRAVYTHERSLGGAVWDFVSPGLRCVERRLADLSPHKVMAHIMGNAKIIADGRDRKNHVIDLNGHDEWVEVYMDECLDVTGRNLSISFDVLPGELVSSCGSFVTKGEWQYGVQQDGKDKLNFYINTDKAPESALPKIDPNDRRSMFRRAMSMPKNYRYVLSARLPENWEGAWHHVEACYDGKQMTLSIDGEQLSATEACGNIINAPFPVNIGRNEQSHGQDTQVYICDAMMDNVIISDDSGELLHLDFENEQKEGTFFSYGIGARTYGTIWPDRTVQPEIYQMKKSAQPIACKLLSVDDRLVEIWNRNHFINASWYDFKWELREDGICIQQGDIALDIEPLSKKVVRIPFEDVDIKPGCEYSLMLTSSLSEDQIWAEKGFVMAWDQFELPWKQNARASDKSVGKAVLMKTEDAFVVSGEGFSYTFSSDGQLNGIRQGEEELLESPLRLNVWRAPVAVEIDGWDQGNITYSNRKDWNGSQIANEYYSNNLQQISRIPISCEAYEAGGQVYVNVRCFSQFGPVSSGSLDAYIFGIRYSGFSEVYNYRINGDGTLTLHHVLEPEGTMPTLLPRIGLTMTLNGKMQNVKWYGRGPEENYPDRKTGYPVGVYENDVDGMFEPYLIPQDCGLRCDNRWVEMDGGDGTGLRFSMDKLFNFNAYNYSTDNLTRAVYTYQLQKSGSVTLNLDYETTGVGCTACFVLPGYQVKPTKYERTLTISPVCR
ncbi:MAG: DUF4981 domain-containing protein [Bacteroidales bacterium]|nr:DUF4981 domain-containing protein [Bacteroidales bacterium]